MNDQQQQYRAHLVLAEQKAQEDFDKTVIYLSGGALGVSFAFIKDIVGVNALTHPAWLTAAWWSWSVSVLAVLLSYYSSHLALRRAIKQFDQDPNSPARRLGGCWDLLTGILNGLGAALFFLGLVSMVIFVSQSVGGTK